MLKEMMRRPRYVMDRTLEVIINTSIMLTTLFLIEYLVHRALR